MARRAYALQQLFNEVNKKFPLRDTTSDGWIGDAAHQTRPSDHNPNSAGVVCAQDFDEDAQGAAQLVGRTLWAFILDTKPDRMAYSIYEVKMVRSYDKPGIPAWSVAEYTGPNGHLYHLHLSVSQDPSKYDDPSPWGFVEWMEDPLNVTRIIDAQYPDRFGTAWAIARTRFPNPSDGKTVVLATEDFSKPDGALSPVLGYPVLLVPKDGEVPGGTAAGLRHYAVEKILVVGGSNSISDNMYAKAWDISQE